ncbi:carbohydrate kinase [Staphylococcus sp. GDY8P57P]|uniref:carbohydrate kinase family protein n=1 Tax=Staphylococcus sp. GDY8P57P TaxID=2804128 RepID=UPI00187F75F9|nr:carbohydrate kinase [Staphylococcus sp. GDY8P57P]MBF2758378.1 carbohydrate kinase [Staphylococcus haemolyticus]MBF2773170.1 carbohydrate kinase [Staphylococcus haemolyticus]MBF2777389.1 carbohydrate kinase [Staphylococcus haemolyticus]MBF2815292.1 carbohydrate kinase [Staphylococcus haemolyticus]MBF9720592.1 carbohydrate kinase [Staphylococcus haemolyticus]
MRKLYGIGEALIDFIPNVKNSELKDVEQFSRQVGGAPANVVSVARKMGASTEMVTQLGNDAFGDIIVETLSNLGVGTQFIRRTDVANTALAFVSLKEDGQRDFSFYRKPSADMLYKADYLDEISINPNDILHFCSVDLVESDMKEAHQAMIDKFKSANGTIVFDPNVRLPLWHSAEACKETIQAFIPKANIIKVSDEELEFITGEADEESAIQSLFQGSVVAVIYTQGPNGASIILKDGTKIYHEGFKVKAVDTTGAGDAFIGAAISRILLSDEVNMTKLLKEEGQAILQFSNFVAAKVTTKCGAIESIPTLEEVTSELK